MLIIIAWFSTVNITLLVSTDKYFAFEKQLKH